MHVLFSADYFSDVPSTCGSQRSLSSSICTFQESSSYVKGVDGQVFKDRMQVSMYALELQYRKDMDTNSVIQASLSSLCILKAFSYDIREIWLGDCWRHA